MRRFQPFLLTRWVCGLKYCLCFCCFSSCLAYRQRGRVRDVVYRRQTERELLITPINNLSQPQDIELGLPAACFRLRAMKPSKALVIKTQTWLSQDSEAGSSLFGDNGVFSPPSLHRLPRQPPWRILTKSFALIVCTAVDPRYPSPRYLLHFTYKSAQSVIGRLREIEKKPSPSENKWHHMRSHPPAAAENYRAATSGGVAKASQPADKQQAHQKMSFPGIIYF